MRKALAVILLILGIWGQGRAATYTVGASGCDYTTIQGVFDGVNLAGGDIIEVRADTPGGSKTYAEVVTPGSNDGGDLNNPVIVQGRAGDSITVAPVTGKGFNPRDHKLLPHY